MATAHPEREMFGFDGFATLTDNIQFYIQAMRAELAIESSETRFDEIEEALRLALAIRVIIYLPKIQEMAKQALETTADGRDDEQETLTLQALRELQHTLERIMDDIGGLELLFATTGILESDR